MRALQPQHNKEGIMNNGPIEEVPGLYRILPLHPLRRTPGVSFDVMFDDLLPRIDAVDRVLHAGGAVSPGPVDGIERPWYMHTHQDDNLLVMHGIRYVDIYTHVHGHVLSFEVGTDYVKRGQQIVSDQPAILVWPRGVFHRVRSDSHVGSASVNLATHYDGFDVATNFSIYDVDILAKSHHVIRKGALDQT
jgi:hypothetical protein